MTVSVTGICGAPSSVQRDDTTTYSPCHDGPALLFGAGTAADPLTHKLAGSSKRLLMGAETGISCNFHRS